LAKWKCWNNKWNWNFGWPNNKFKVLFGLATSPFLYYVGKVRSGNRVMHSLAQVYQSKKGQCNYPVLWLLSWWQGLSSSHDICRLCHVIKNRFIFKILEIYLQVKYILSFFQIKTFVWPTTKDYERKYWLNP
jgi:hypothetical protein